MDLPLLITMLATCVIVVLCVLLHYEGLRGLSRWVTTELLPPRWRITTLIFGLILLHSAEIWLFAFGYFLLENVTGYADFLHLGFGEGMVELMHTRAVKNDASWGVSTGWVPEGYTDTANWTEPSTFTRPERFP